MTQNKKIEEIYKQLKTDFLDNLLPDDFRNGGSFNQADMIIEHLNKALYNAVMKNENGEEYIKKAVTHLFREDSLAVAKAIELSRVYLEMRKESL